MAYSESMRSDFGKVLDELLTARGLTPLAFAKSAGVYRSFIYKLLDGQSPPPAKRIAEWAGVLKLTPKERNRLFVAAGLEHVPSPLREVVKSALRRDLKP